eukprot:TRINITY_DN2432_c0_g2_i1.p1 TRINITY_DN2432_c0_g2~~TRINITY_DN2432_c0_g2_i1.p1  ORF type:complete len:592 (-),score=150.53 TRINITY_DN2432_c0_g2_i1:94-1869(-)
MAEPSSAAADAEATEAPAEEAEKHVHEPFSVKVWSLVQDARATNGLRHNDHLRYRQYCARKLRRLYVVLRFKHGKGRFKQVAFPEDFSDVRWIFVPLVQSERAWAFGVQLKADNATAATFNARFRHRSIQRFAKAVAYAKQLEAVCKVHCDQRTQLECEAYTAFLEGTWSLEKEVWSEAKTKLLRCKKLAEHLALAAEPAEAALFRNQLIQDIGPMLRECRYNLGEAEDGDDDSSKKVASDGKSVKAAAGGLSYRGCDISVPSDKIATKLRKCLEMAKALQAESEAEETLSAEVGEKYGELSVEFGDALKDIHAQLIAAGADGDSETADWRTTEAFTREISTCINIERNLLLLRNHLAKLDDIEDATTSEARRMCRPEEGMRFCDLLKEDFQSLSQLPETSESLEATLSTLTKAVLDYRCLYLALCHTSMGKMLEAAALLEMLGARLEEVAADVKDAPEPVGRLQQLFQQLREQLPSRVSSWRCRVLVQLVKASRKEKSADTEVVGSGLLSNQKPKQDALAAFPPKFRDIPCKPLLFDLAFPLIEAPDIESLLPKRKADGQKKGAAAAVAGALGKVAGGLGGRLGGLFGRK